ncbi:CpsD/CapB family tyrosine-protein kinase [Lysinibacillus endophyticus]|uniref:CpsD/CapB family tyrosine-protein kinase n=1 Tax=Ureibacillus endophyticus TaxID=1978490 RepID=UPI0020A0B2ED|nr:CpsD/CapB family tyrosine-protein kinase [Lysinibacillus endophyticus]MCP1144142.1 CpsD/CapB family tyrosine-protein kinase [Lysinibacillus endophyticus]
MSRKLITISEPKSIFSEQFRTIRSNLMFTLPEKNFYSILVTSSIPAEGKSTIVANIGVVFAQEGKKVLIVDADMRRPTLHYTFDFFNVHGLSNVLSRTAKYDEVLNETHVKGLYVLPSGPIPPNPSELLTSKYLDEFIKDMSRYFDIVLFDAPPILPVTDAQMLSKKCDGTILVVDSINTEREEVLKAKSILQASHANILGAILNNTELSKSEYQYYY